MTDPERELRQLVAALRDGPVALSGVEQAEQRRTRLVHHLRDQVRLVPAQRRRRRFLRYTLRSVPGGLLFVGVLFVSLARTGQPELASVAIESVGARPLMWVDSVGTRRALTSAGQLDSSGELAVPEASSAELVTRERVHIGLSAATRLRIGSQLRARTTAQHDASKSADQASPSADQTDTSFFLSSGEVHCSVPPLGKGRAFEIGTPDVRVVVHGTDFTVRVDENPKLPTCVRVREGLVEVQDHGTSRWLGPGNEWGCEPARSALPGIPLATLDSLQGQIKLPSPGVREEPVLPSRHRKRHVGRSHSKPAREKAQPAESGQLEVETELLAAAMRAERADHPERARKLFHSLLHTYPRSPLAPDARAGLSRLR